ncbi:GNAT family N-acetyltransferase [Leifsonia sp. ZF2019]|nr:GNAT family N-acetyltransferase [Leifsonia sp. ZF2019]
MQIRDFDAADTGALVDLTIETFRPFYEDFVRPLFGDAIFAHQHGRWEQDYRDEVPSLHAPERLSWVAVATVDDDTVGYVSWRVYEGKRHGEIYLLAVSPAARRHNVGRELCMHALDRMTDRGDVDVVGIGTGDDAFHAAARGLYESLGFVKVPTAGYLKAL